MMVASELLMVVILNMMVLAPGYRAVPPYCKGKMLAQCVPHDDFGVPIDKEAELDAENPSIETFITAALQCGKECLTTSGPKCTPIIRRIRRVTNGGGRNCNKIEKICSHLVEIQDKAVLPEYFKPSDVSQPQCKQNIRKLKWIKNDNNQYCKVVRSSPERESCVTAASCGCCECNECLRLYSVKRICRPNGYAKRVFCVYCPKEDSRTLGDPHGKMEIVSRVYPQCCTCNKEWCSRLW